MARMTFDEAWRQQRGFQGDASYNGPMADPRRWGGTSGQVVNGYIQPGTSGADVDVARYRSMGEAAGQMQGPQINQARTGESRGLQMGSLASLEDVAAGRSSEALRMGQAQARDAALGQQSMAASVRGGAMARAGAARAANLNSARTQAQIMNSARAGQAAEMADARGRLFQGATQQRAQDLALATDQAKLQAQQRALNEQQQQGLERMGWDVRSADQGAGLETQQQMDAQKAANRKYRLAERQQEEQAYITAGSTVLGAMGGMSDERAKTQIMPVGSLARLMR